MSDDWLDISPPEEKAGLPAVVAAPLDPRARVALIEDCWSRLSLSQRTFLTAMREGRFNARRAARKLEGIVARESHIRWMHESDYATVLQLWRAAAAGEALDKDRLLARQDDIVETLLTPKPILHQGVDTGHREVNAAGASRANETLMKAAGLLKDKELDISIGIVGPEFIIQVVEPNGAVRDATPRGVTIDLPAPEDADWTE